MNLIAKEIGVGVNGLIKKIDLDQKWLDSDESWDAAISAVCKDYITTVEAFRKETSSDLSPPVLYRFCEAEETIGTLTISGINECCDEGTAVMSWNSRFVLRRAYVNFHGKDSRSPFVSKTRMRLIRDIDLAALIAKN